MYIDAICMGLKVNKRRTWKGSRNSRTSLILEGVYKLKMLLEILLIALRDQNSINKLVLKCQRVFYSMDHQEQERP